MPNDPRTDPSSQTTVNLLVRRRALLNGNTDLAVGIRNLFDEDMRHLSPMSGGLVEVLNDLPAADRFYFMELRYRF